MSERQAIGTAAQNRQPIVSDGVTVERGNLAFIDASEEAVLIAGSPVRCIGVYQETVVGDGVKRVRVRGGNNSLAYMLDNKAGDLVVNTDLVAYASTDSEVKQTNAGTDIPLNVHRVSDDGVEITFGNADISLPVTGGALSGPLAIAAANANALAVGLNGATNPAIQVDTATAVSATGVKVKSAAAAGGVAISAISSGTNEDLTIDAKGSGTVTINGTATGIVVLPAGTTIGGSTVSALGVITSASANALTAGLAGATNPAFNVDASTALSATGVDIKSAAAAGGVAISALSSGANENMTIDAKGSGTVTLNGTGTGNVISGANLEMTDAKDIVLATGTGTAIGTAVGQKLAFHGVTPVVQAASAEQVAPAAYGTGAFGLDSDAKMEALFDLVVAMRTALVDKGIMKGSA